MKGCRPAIVWIELLAALSISAFVVVLNTHFRTHAGPLWRDEVSTVGLATKAPYAEMFRSLALDSAPALYPTLLRLVISPWAGIAQDVPARVFGFAVATALVAALWAASSALRAGAPLFTLTLFAAHPGFLQAVGMIKPYGLGTVFIVLVFAGIGRLALASGRNTLIVAVIAAVLSVQSLYHNVPLILALCIAGLVVPTSGRRWMTRSAIITTGAAAALSLVPYLGILQSSWEWRPLNQRRFGTSWLLSWSSDMVTLQTWALGVLWAEGLLLASFGTILACRQSSTRDRTRGTGAVRYAAVTTAAATVLYLTFLRLAGRIPLTWQFVPLMAILGVAIDVVLAHRLITRWARLALISLVAITMLPYSMAGVGTRQTNIDLIAERLHSDSRPGDLIVISPWYLGITFDRYYRGTVKWVTVPPVADHSVHRYDVIRLQMMSPAPLAPVLAAIRGTLASGHRVWIVGHLPHLEPGWLPPPLPPAPSLPTGWSDEPYADGWPAQLRYFVQLCASRVTHVDVPVDASVNPLESEPLERAEGWRQHALCSATD